MKFKNHFYILLTLIIFGWSCADPNAGSGDAGEGTEQDSDSKNKESNLLEIEGQLFSIPSPVQTALLIKEVGSNFDASILNDPKSYSNYSTGFQKAINLGIYGADLGYVTIYEQTQDALSYFASVKKLGDELGVTAAFDMTLAERFEKNLSDKDSLLSLVSDAFKASDSYLKNNKRNDIGGLILTGGWIESLYFSTIVAKQSSNDDIITRIGAQKSTANNLVKLLMPYYSKQEYKMLIDQLQELNAIFEGIEVEYTYNKPEVDVENKLTTITSTTDIRITDEQLEAITSLVSSIRNNLI